MIRRKHRNKKIQLAKSKIRVNFFSGTPSEKKGNNLLRRWWRWRQLIQTGEYPKFSYPHPSSCYYPAVCSNKAMNYPCSVYHLNLLYSWLTNSSSPNSNVNPSCNTIKNDKDWIANSQSQWRTTITRLTSQFFLNFRIFKRRLTQILPKIFSQIQGFYMVLKKFGIQVTINDLHNLFCFLVYLLHFISFVQI